MMRTTLQQAAWVSALALVLVLGWLACGGCALLKPFSTQQSAAGAHGQSAGGDIQDVWTMRLLAAGVVAGPLVYPVIIRPARRWLGDLAGRAGRTDRRSSSPDDA